MHADKNSMCDLARVTLLFKFLSLLGVMFVTVDPPVSPVLTIGSKLGKNYACTYLGEWEGTLLKSTALNRIPGGGFKAPSGFSCAIAKRRKTESSYSVTFPKHSCIAHILTKKMPGQVRSGHQRRIVDPTKEKFAITPELEFLTDRFLLLRF